MVAPAKAIFLAFQHEEDEKGEDTLFNLKETHLKSHRALSFTFH
jgi:hypothetical protein